MRSAKTSVHFSATLPSKFRLVPGNSFARATGTAERAKDFWEKPRVPRATLPLYEWTIHKGLERMPGCLNTAKRLLLVRRFCVIYTPTILFIRSLFSSIFFTQPLKMILVMQPLHMFIFPWEGGDETGLCMYSKRGRFQRAHVQPLIETKAIWQIFALGKVWVDI